MNDRPICIFRDGSLWLDRGFHEYDRTPDYMVRSKRWALAQWPESHAQSLAEIDEALRQYEEWEKTK